VQRPGGAGRGSGRERDGGGAAAGPAGWGSARLAGGIFARKVRGAEVRLKLRVVCVEELPSAPRLVRLPHLPRRNGVRALGGKCNIETRGRRGWGGIARPRNLARVFPHSGGADVARKMLLHTFHQRHPPRAPPPRTPTPADGSFAGAADLREVRSERVAVVEASRDGAHPALGMPARARRRTVGVRHEGLLREDLEFCGEIRAVRRAQRAQLRAMRGREVLSELRGTGLSGAHGGRRGRAVLVWWDWRGERPA
jgi:hypothetical protein